MIYVYFFTGILLLISMILLFSGSYFYNFSIKRKADYEPLEEYYVNLRNEKKWLYSNPIEDVSISSTDLLTLRGKYIKADKSTNKLAIVVHGYTSKGEDMAGFALLYNKKMD